MAYRKSKRKGYDIITKWFKTTHLYDCIWHRYPGTWYDYPDVGKVTTEDIYRFTIKHLHWWDRFDKRMISEWTTTSQDILFGAIKPKDKTGKWKYPYYDWE